MIHHPPHFEGPIYVLGGGPLGCRYLSELIRAQAEGLLPSSEICFIDPNVNAPAIEKFKSQVRYIENTYTGFLEEFIRTRATTGPQAGILVPDHSAPHVLFRVFLDLIENDSSFKGKTIHVLPFPTSQSSDFPKTPFLKTFDSGICAVSYAEWICPLECEEPTVCPAIQQDRTWNFNETFSHYTRDHHLDTSLSSHLFSCIQLVYGVSFISLDHVLHEWERLRHKLSTQKQVKLLVATYSKCHGIVGTARIEG